MPPSKQENNKEAKLLQEIIAIVLIGLGLLILLSLISFDKNDLELFCKPPNDPPVNFIGVAGAYVAGTLAWAFGLGSFLIPLVMVLGGIGMLFSARVDYPWKALWFFLLLLSGCALLQLGQPLLGPLADFGRMAYAGGYMGHFFNDIIFAAAMGPVGSGIAMGITYLVSFILLFEVRPVEIAQRLAGWVRVWWEARQQAKLEAADPIERLEIEQKKIQRAARQLEKELAKKGMVETAPKAMREGGTASRPAPKIFDATVKPAVEEHEPAAVTEKKSAPPHPQTKPKGSAPLEIAPTESYENYQLPGVDLLLANTTEIVAGGKEEMEHNSQLLVDTLKQFEIDVTPGDITKGATITRYEVYPAAGVRVERISSLEKNLARALKAERVNILAPIPGKDTVGIEVPNRQKVMIVLRDLLESGQWRNLRARLPIALGKDVYGSVLMADLADMPHLLIAGTTGSGKSVCINCILLSLLYRFSPDDLRIILVDPKVVELQVYNQLPHLVVPVVTDPKKVLVALRWVINEMEKRYRIMARTGVRNIAAYNQQAHDKRQKEKLDLDKELEAGENGPEAPDLLSIDPSEEEPLPDRLPYIVVIIDELADLMQTSPADVELAIARLSAKARAAGIHLIIATQTPRAQVITGVIKTNVPCRIAFQVPSALDSRVILDENGAENLLGKGDLLYLPPGSAKLVRAQGAYVSEEEVTRVVNFISKQCRPAYENEIHAKLKRTGAEEEEVSDEDKELILKCLEVVRQEKRASTSLLQRRLRIGYSRASWVTDWMEQKGIVGPKDGAKDREVLMDLDQTDIESLLE